jgi:hypothetical protein
LPFSRAIDLEKMRETKRFWSRWCTVHDGFPPIQDSATYRCKNCGAMACSLDIFETSEGKWCGNCVQQFLMGNEWIEARRKFELAKSQSRIAKIAILFGEIFLLQSVVLQLVDSRFHWGIIQTSMAVYLSMVGMLLLTSLGALLLFLEKNDSRAANSQKTK